MNAENAHTIPPTSRLDRIAPGLAMLRGYQRAWLRYDLAAGLSVAAVALPTAIAYAQLAGFPPVVGLYASILPLVVYAVLGTSRQLIVNPDAAVCAMVAAIVAPLAAGTRRLYIDAGGLARRLRRRRRASSPGSSGSVFSPTSSASRCSSAS